MFSSTIIPTIGRPSLAAAVGSVLAQEGTKATFEIIVVNDSGSPLDDGPWRHSSRVRVLESGCVERSGARNAGAAAARGEFLHFLDDDDLLLPGAIERLWRLRAQVPEALWLYGAWQTFDRAGRFVGEFHPNVTGDLFPLLVAGEGLPLQASLVRARAFAEIGGFDPDPQLIGVEDRELGRRLALAGAVAYTDDVLARVHIGQAGSSTNWSVIGHRDRLGRERALARSEALGRLRASRLNPYWCGRVARAYVGSASLNLSRWRPVRALQRAVQGGVLAHAHLLRPSFWRGLRMGPEVS